MESAPEGLAIDAVEWLPSGARSGLVRVRARWTQADPPDLPLPELLVSGRRVTSLPDPRAARDPRAWRGAYVFGADLFESAEELVLEFASGESVRLPAATLVSPAPPGPTLVLPEEDEQAPGEVIDRAVLAERRARKAEAAEQAQARIAREALKAVEVLELRGADLERRLEDLTAERDTLETRAREAERTGAEAETERAAAARAADEATTELAAARREAEEAAERRADAERAAREAARAAAEAEAARPAPLPPPPAPDDPALRAAADRQAAAEQRAAAAEQAADAAEARAAAAETAATEAAAEATSLRERLAELEVREERLRAATAVQPTVQRVEERARRHREALAAALADVARLRGQLVDWRLRYRSLETTRAGDAVRLAVLEAGDPVEARRRIEALERELEESRARLAAAEAEIETLRAAATEAAPSGREEALEDALAAVEADRDQARAAADRAVAELRSERVARAALGADLERERASRPAPLDAPPTRDTEESATPVDPAELARRAAALTGPAPPTDPDESARVAAHLDAAAAALRGRSPRDGGPAPPDAPVPELTVPPPPDAPTADPTDLVPAPPDAPTVRRPTTIVPATGELPRRLAIGEDARAYPPLRGAVVKLAHADPTAAARLLLGLAPALAGLLDDPLDFDLTVEELGTFSVTVEQDHATIAPIAGPRSRRAAAFHLRADALTLAEILSGVGPKPRRFRGRARLQGRRNRYEQLAALRESGRTLADAVRAGARLEPGAALFCLPYVVHPAWTRGHAFSVLVEVDEVRWLVTAHDGAGLSVTSDAPATPPDATLTLSRTAFSGLLAGEPPQPGDEPAVTGDEAAAVTLRAWAALAATAGGATH